jgi:DNA invertase Pin-like site-specific DNA recombinase
MLPKQENQFFKRYIAYYRVSTSKQGVSGLGLSAQQTTVLNYLHGFKPIEEYTDIESGTAKGNNRENLKVAIKRAKELGAVLVIAKLDRLARNVRFITTLMESQVPFEACDMPQATPFTIHIFAALAEQEAKLISQRTKAALAEKKKQGAKLGKPENLTSEAIIKSQVVRSKNAEHNENNRKAGALVVSMRNAGNSFYQIMNELNKLDFKTRRDCNFKIMQVQRLYNRYNRTT